jgi:hypothetical protein
MKGEGRAAGIATGMGIVPGLGIQFGKERRRPLHSIKPMQPAEMSLLGTTKN